MLGHNGTLMYNGMPLYAHEYGRPRTFNINTPRVNVNGQNMIGHDWS